MSKDKFYSIVGSRKVWLSVGGIATAVCALAGVDNSISTNILGVITALGAFASIVVEKITNKKDDDNEENT